MPVVSVLGVVIVLDDVAVDVACPRDDGPAARRREHCARGKLVRRRDQYDAGRRASELLDDDAVAVDRHRIVFGSKPSQLGALPAMTGILDGERRVPGVEQLASDQAQSVSEPVADDYLVGVGDNTANPTEVLSDGAAQLG